MKTLTLPRLGEGDVVSVASAVPNEGVLALAVGIAASGAGFAVPPVKVAAVALGARKTDRFEDLRGVELLRIRLELGPGQRFDLLFRRKCVGQEEKLSYLPLWRGMRLCLK